MNPFAHFESGNANYSRVVTADIELDANPCIPICGPSKTTKIRSIPNPDSLLGRKPIVFNQPFAQRFADADGLVAENALQPRFKRTPRVPAHEPTCRLNDPFS